MERTLIIRRGKFTVEPDQDGIRFTMGDPVVEELRDGPVCPSCGWGLTYLNTVEEWEKTNNFIRSVFLASCPYCRHIIAANSDWDSFADQLLDYFANLSNKPSSPAKAKK